MIRTLTKDNFMDFAKQVYPVTEKTRVIFADSPEEAERKRKFKDALQNDTSNPDAIADASIGDRVINLTFDEHENGLIAAYSSEVDILVIREDSLL